MAYRGNLSCDEIKVSLDDSYLTSGPSHQASVVLFLYQSLQGPWIELFFLQEKLTRMITSLSQH